MALLERPSVKWLAEQAEERLGVSLIATQERTRLVEAEREYGEFRDEAEELAWHSLDYFSGRPSELRPERRRRIAQRSRIALMQDPLAGAEAQLLADFAFGRGVSKPTARNEKVQKVIDRAWTDANNEEKLTSFPAQRKLSNELLTTGELFITLYEQGGNIRIGRLDPDLVEQVIPDPEDRLRPLYYMCRVRRYEWDYERDQAILTDEAQGDGRPKVQYWKHWRNVEDAERERELSPPDPNEAPLKAPPESKLARGVVFHLAINQTGEQLRGNPPWQRTLRFFTAMNLLTEAHVTMAQAQSTIIAKRVMQGSPRQITRAANSILSNVGELGAGMRGSNAESPTQPFAPGAPPPMAPGSWFDQNQSMDLQPVNLRSGSGEMAQTAQIVRAPIAASGGFGQHYYGDASNANLATAATLELPATMRVQAWQEFFEGMYRWFTDRAIESAVRAGLLGGRDAYDSFGQTPMAELRLHESQDRDEMEDRTDKDLSYEFTMPFPGRRQLTDVATFVQNISQSQDPQGVNVPLRRLLAREVFEAMGIDDIARAIEECFPEEGMRGGIGPQEDPVVVDPATGQPVPATGANGTAANPEKDPPEGRNRYGAKSQSAAVNKAQEAEWIPDDMRGAVTEYGTDTMELFRSLVTEPAIVAALQLAAPAPVPA